MACRACLKLSVLLGIMLLYAIFWAWCTPCTLWLTALTCTASIFGASFVSPGCLSGVVLILLNGIHLGAGPLHLDVRWDT